MFNKDAAKDKKKGGMDNGGGGTSDLGKNGMNALIRRMAGR
jgi:hypothetical protein